MCEIVMMCADCKEEAHCCDRCEEYFCYNDEGYSCWHCNQGYCDTECFYETGHFLCPEDGDVHCVEVGLPSEFECEACLTDLCTVCNNRREMDCGHLTEVCGNCYDEHGGVCSDCCLEDDCDEQLGIDTPSSPDTITNPAFDHVKNPHLKVVNGKEKCFCGMTSGSGHLPGGIFCGM